MIDLRKPQAANKPILVNYAIISPHASFLAQHTYEGTADTDVLFRSWFDKGMMNTCTTITAVWHVKQLH